MAPIQAPIRPSPVNEIVNKKLSKFIWGRVGRNIFPHLFKVEEICYKGKTLIKEETKWTPPEETTINSDASISNGTATFALLVRRGYLFIFCACKKIKTEEIRTPTHAEAGSIAWGLLKSTHTIGLKRICIQTDSPEGYKMVENPTKEDKNGEEHTKKDYFTTTLAKARALMIGGRLIITCDSVNREENSPADFLANIAKTMGDNEERSWTKKVPRGLKDLLIQDLGISKVKLVPGPPLVTIRSIIPSLKPISEIEKYISEEDKERANIMSTWVEVLEEDISTQRINLIIVRLSSPDTVYNLYKIRIYYHKDRSAKNAFRMLKEKLHRFDIFEELASKVPKECCLEVFRQYIKGKKKETLAKPPVVEMNEKEMALPAFEMGMGTYDFGNFRTIDTMISHRKGARIEEISNDLNELKKLEEEETDETPQILYKVGETLKIY